MAQRSVRRDVQRLLDTTGMADNCLVNLAIGQRLEQQHETKVHALAMTLRSLLGDLGKGEKNRSRRRLDVRHSGETGQEGTVYHVGRALEGCRP